MPIDRSSIGLVETVEESLAYIAFSLTVCPYSDACDVIVFALFIEHKTNFKNVYGVICVRPCSVWLPHMRCVTRRSGEYKFKKTDHFE